MLVVDDEQPVRQLLGRILSGGGYTPHLATSVTEALAVLETGEVDLVLCDVMMTGLSGISMLRRLREYDATIPLVMVSGTSNPELSDAALELGADGYVTQPFDASQVLIAASGALRRSRLERENRLYRERLESMVFDRTAALTVALDDLRSADDRLQHSAEISINALAQAIEGRDIETGQHVVRVGRYTKLLALGCGFDEDGAQLMGVASAMHDIGKIGVPDGILFKPGAFSPPEYEVIKQHAEFGYRILAKSELPLLDTAASIARSHHERWDGSGYPYGLEAEAIPIEGRITAVADVFDAVISRRCYKPAYPVERALEVIRAGRGVSFDATVVDVFFGCIEEIVEIRNDFPDV